jgi:hypothetical protein
MAEPKRPYYIPKPKPDEDLRARRAYETLQPLNLKFGQAIILPQNGFTQALITTRRKRLEVHHA